MANKKKPGKKKDQKKPFEDPFDKIAGKQNSVAPGDWFEEPKNY